MSRAAQVPPPSGRVEVTILGQRLVLKGIAQPERVVELAAYVQRRLDDIAAQSGAQGVKLAVLAALNIADDHARAVAGAAAFREEVAQRSRALLAQLEAAPAELLPVAAGAAPGEAG